MSPFNFILLNLKQMQPSCSDFVSLPDASLSFATFYFKLTVCCCVCFTHQCCRKGWRWTCSSWRRCCWRWYPRSNTPRTANPQTPWTSSSGSWTCRQTNENRVSVRSKPPRSRVPRRSRSHSLVVEVLPLTVDLVLQGEVEGHVFDFLLHKDLGAGCVLLLLQVLDHVREPHRQTVVAERGTMSQSWHE